MKKIFSISYPAWAFNFAMAFLRVCSGVLMVNHGYDKLVKYQSMAPDFNIFPELGGHVSLALLIFAEFFCAMFLILGLFTRLAAIPLLISTAVATAKAHNMDVFGDGEMSSLFFICFTVILLLGPGRISIDGMINK